MGGYFPGPLGIATFAGIRLAGCAAAALALEKIEPTIASSILKIYLLLAAVRIAMGVLPLSILTKQIQLWPFATAGSFEWPAIKWRMAVPGQLPLCC
jgi:hypothetical protein